MNTSVTVPDLDYYRFDEETVSRGELVYPSIEKAMQAALVVTLCITTTTSNLVTVVSVLSIPKRHEVLDFYILSLSMTNLVVSVLIIPLALAAKANVLGCFSYILCSVSGYLHISLTAVYLYTFMWISVDRYIAVRKPLRYDVIQTRTRCKCWILFTWVMSTCLCCPPLLGDSKGHFYDESFMCLLDVDSMLPYCITLGCLVFTPSILTTCYTYCCVFSTPSPVKKEEGDRFSSDHVSTFAVSVAFVIFWLPWGVLRVLEYASSAQLAGPTLRFWLLLFGQMHTTISPIVLLSTCGRCLIGLRVICRFCLKTESSVRV